MPIRHASIVLSSLALAVAGCASLPPGSSYPRTASKAFEHPEETRLGEAARARTADHVDTSGFRLLSIGIDGFLTRIELADQAQRTLDLQYFILRADRSGRALTDALLRAADRGVRVRILVDDGETMPGDEKIALLDAHPNIEVRVFNPFAYRGHSPLIRAIEFTASGGRLDYRMHNKLFVADNAIALVGGRNVADEYFQIDPKTQFADDDVFSVGPVVSELSHSFDRYWNDASSIPVPALYGAKSTPDALADYRRELVADRDEPLPDGQDYRGRVAAGDPLNGMTSGQLPLEYATWHLVVDSPDKKDIEKGWRVGALMERPVAEATNEVQHELLMITPYLVPGEDGMRLLDGVRERGARLGILTNSLESQTVPPAQASYMHYRIPLLKDGVELFEVRSLLGSTRGSGQSAAISRFGNYSLHGKMYVFDRRRVFIGSMNFDQRSMHLNTEIGLIIDSPAIARQVVARFDAMTAPENAYHVTLEGNGPLPPKLAWTTVEHGLTVRYDEEPAKSALQKLRVEAMTVLPMDSEM